MAAHGSFRQGPRTSHRLTLTRRPPQASPVRQDFDVREMGEPARQRTQRWVRSLRSATGTFRIDSDRTQGGAIDDGRVSLPRNDALSPTEKRHRNGRGTSQSDCMLRELRGLLKQGVDRRPSVIGKRRVITQADDIGAEPDKFVHVANRDLSPGLAGLEYERDDGTERGAGK